jgi:hypothetical protein
MASSTSASSQTKNTRTLWAIVGLSVTLNVGLVGYWLYVTNIDVLPLQQIVVANKCNEPGYTKWMHTVETGASNPAQAKKFAAAATCFVDYETGRELDLDSLKPQTDGAQALPARP